METVRRSLVKALTWRVIAVLITTAVAWSLTSEITFAVTIGVCDMLAKIVLYYLHERAWNSVDYGREIASENAD